MIDAWVWHEWFAWRPVKVNGGWVWLRTIMRRLVFPNYDCEQLPVWRYVEFT